MPVCIKNTPIPAIDIEYIKVVGCGVIPISNINIPRADNPTSINPNLIDNHINFDGLFTIGLTKGIHIAEQSNKIVYSILNILIFKE